jgi:hypothetical protein
MSTPAALAQKLLDFMTTTPPPKLRITPRVAVAAVLSQRNTSGPSRPLR